MAWIVLSLNWNLGDVRAVLTLLISIFCVVGVWTLASCRWRLQNRKISHSTSVELLSLLSINSVSDAYEAISIVPWTQQPGVYLPLIGQCAAVVLLAAVGMLAGPLAKWSTHRGSVLVNGQTEGFIAGGRHSDMIDMPVYWNQTMEKLDTAGFPHDQLLDFLPDQSADWQYDASQWNSSWKLYCNQTHRTSFSFVTTGNSTGKIFTEVPALLKAFPREPPDGYNRRRVEWVWRGHIDFDIVRDMFVFVVFSTNPSRSIDDTARIESNNETLYISINAYHVSGVPYSTDPDATTSFGKGTADRAEYTGIQCKIHQVGGPHDPMNVANPWSNETDALVTAYANFYEEKLARLTHTTELLYPPEPLELLRFYQAYMVTKDTQPRHRVTRTLTFKHQSVEISSAAVAVLGLYFACVVLGLLWTSYDGWREKRRGGKVAHALPVPRSQLDWLLQCVRESGGREFHSSFFDKEARDLKPDARAAVFGPIQDRYGQVHLGTGRRIDAPFVVPMTLAWEHGKP